VADGWPDHEGILDEMDPAIPKDRLEGINNNSKNIDDIINTEY
jgi:hypothetical protein